MKKENKNVIFNVGYQMVMYLFPLITSSYVSQTIGAEKLGIYSYVSSYVTVAGLFCLLGISNYGNREIAKIRDDKRKLSQVFSSIYALQLLLSLIVIVTYYSIVLIGIKEHKIFFLIQGIVIFSAALDNSWVFFGLEKFKVTLTRNFVIRCVSMIFIILFVKKPEDLWKYALIMSSASLISQMFLWCLRSMMVKFVKVSVKEIFLHFKPVCILFIPVVAFSIYQVMDKTMLGYLYSTTEVAFYENAERIISIPVMIINAIGMVMLPHMAYSIKNKKEDYLLTIKNSMHLAIEFSVFAAVGMIVVKDDIVVLLFGKEFIPSGNIVALLAFDTVAVAWANVIRTQFLIPTNRDMIYVTSSFIGAFLNLVLNLIFIRDYGAIGACIGTIVAEFAIAIYQTFFVVKELQVSYYFIDLIKSLFFAVCTGGLIWLMGQAINILIFRLVAQIIVAISILFIVDRKFIIYEFFGKKKI